MSVPSAKRKVMGRIDLVHDHHQGTPSPSTSTSKGIRIAADGRTSTPTPVRRLGGHAATPGSSGRAKVDMAALPLPSTREGGQEATPHLIKRAATSAGLSHGSSASPSPFLRKSVASPAPASSSAPVTPRIEGGATSTVPSRRSPEAVSSPFERGEIPANVTVRRSGSVRRVRDHSKESSGSPSPMLNAVSASGSSNASSGSTYRAIASPPFNGRSSPVRGLHVRAKSHHTPTAASLNITPTVARVNIGGQGGNLVSGPFTSFGSHAAINCHDNTSNSFRSPSPSSSVASRSYFPVGSEGGHSEWDTPEQQQHGHRASLRDGGRPFTPHVPLASSRRSSVSLGSTVSDRSLRNYSTHQQSGGECNGPTVSNPPLSASGYVQTSPSKQYPLTPLTPAYVGSSSRPRLDPGMTAFRSGNVSAPTTADFDSPHRDFQPPMSAPLLSPKSERPSLQSQPSSNVLTLEYAQLRVERKIADLEITNKSLLAINSGLEVAKHRQARELRELKKRLREGRGLSLGPGEIAAGAASALSPGSRFAEDEDDDYFGEDEEEEHAKEDPELEAAHVRCRDLIDSMLTRAREAILSRYEPEEVKSKVLTPGEVEERHRHLIGGGMDSQGEIIPEDASVSWIAEDSLASSLAPDLSASTTTIAGGDDVQIVETPLDPGVSTARESREAGNDESEGEAEEEGEEKEEEEEDASQDTSADDDSVSSEEGEEEEDEKEVNPPRRFIGAADVSID